MGNLPGYRRPDGRVLGLAIGSIATVLWVVGVGAAGGDLRLLDAVKRSDSVAVRTLLKQGADVNVRDGAGASALHLAVARDDQGTVDALIKGGADVNAANDLGVTPVWVASSVGASAVAEKLLVAGAKPNVAGPGGVTPLMLAARVGDVKGVKSLITHGADVNAKEQTKDQTTLMWAVIHHHADVVQALVDAKADLTARSKVWKQWVMLCCQDYNMDTGSPTYVDQGGFTAFLYAAQQGDVESAKALLAGGAKITDTLPTGASALVVAAFTGRGPFVNFLLDKGADPAADGAGYTALHTAVLRADTPMAKALIAHGAPLNARLAKATFALQGDYAFNKNWLGATPLWLAAAFHDAELMRILLAAGADPQLPRRDGTTPLIAAAGTAKLIDWQPESRRGIPQTGGTSMKPVEGEEPPTLASVKLLVDAHVDLNTANSDGDTALHRASAKRHLTVVKFLVESGARMDLKNKRGLTPLGMARADTPQAYGTQDGEFGKLVVSQLDAPREKLVALLKELGAKE